MNDKLRDLHGFSAKKLGKESEKIQQLFDEEFKSYICKAIDAKLKTRAKWVSESVNLPLAHYYEYGEKRVEKPEYNWITEHIEMRVKQLKDYYERKI